MSSNAAAPVGAFPSIASCAESPPSSKRSVGAGHARAAAGSPGSGRPGARHAEPPAWRGLVLAPLCPRHPACHRHVSALGVRRRRRGSTQARALWPPRGAVGPPGPARLALWLLQTRVPSVKCGRSERKVRDHVSWSPGVRTAPSRMVEPCWVSDEAPRLVHPIPRLGPLQATPDLSVFPASPPPTSAYPGAPRLPVLSGLGPRGGAGPGSQLWVRGGGLREARGAGLAALRRRRGPRPPATQPSSLWVWRVSKAFISLPIWSPPPVPPPHLLPASCAGMPDSPVRLVGVPEGPARFPGQKGHLPPAEPSEPHTWDLRGAAGPGAVLRHGSHVLPEKGGSRSASSSSLRCGPLPLPSSTPPQPRTPGSRLSRHPPAHPVPTGPHAASLPCTWHS